MNQYVFTIRNVKTDKCYTCTIYANTWQVARGILQLGKDEILVE